MKGRIYPRTFIQQLFVDGYFGEAALRKNAEVIEAVSQSCLTTGFCLWCQLALQRIRKCHAATFK